MNSLLTERWGVSTLRAKLRGIADRGMLAKRGNTKGPRMSLGDVMGAPAHALGPQAMAVVEAAILSNTKGRPINVQELLTKS